MRKRLLTVFFAAVITGIIYNPASIMAAPEDVDISISENGIEEIEELEAQANRGYSPYMDGKVSEHPATLEDDSFSDDITESIDDTLSQDEYDSTEEVIISQPSTEDRGVTEVIFSGAYYVTDKDIILKRLNEIRKEACNQGINGLKPGDYRELKWSSDLEEVARIRAAEADLYEAHTRPNGQRCFTVKSKNGVASYAENLAWNGDGLLFGIEQFYQEKYDLINKTGGQTGHYLAIINPEYKSVGMGCYKMNGKYWYGVAQEFSYDAPLSESQDKSSGSTKVAIECLNENVTGISIKAPKQKEVAVGASIKLEAKATVKYVKYTSIAVTGDITAGDCWSSSNTAIAKVSRDGTVSGISPGYVDISVMTGYKQAKVNIEVFKPLDLSYEAKIEFADSAYEYTGYEIEPVVIVKVKENDAVLKLTKDYVVKSYANNINAGVGTVTIEGCGRNIGLLSANFNIKRAEVSVYARDITVKQGGSLPSAYPCKALGLRGNDEIITSPKVEFSVANTDTLGEYEAIPSGAVIGNKTTGNNNSSNYDIFYYSGTLTVAKTEVVFNVLYSVDGVTNVIRVSEGRLISPKDVCDRPGYEFVGFFKDPLYKVKWDMSSDVVTGNTTLYPMWKKSLQADFSVSVIEDVIYTGSALTPKVKVTDGLYELKEGKDFKITYNNNTECSARRKTGDGIAQFSDSLPSAHVIGINDYEGEVFINFNIVRRAIDGSDGTKAAVAKYINQIDNTAADTTVVTSVNIGNKALSIGSDFTVELSPIEAYDQGGNKISASVRYSDNKVPSGITGSFVLTISGAHNYTGSLYGTVYVASPDKLLKNAKITLGRDLKKIKYSNNFHYFRASMKPMADSYTVMLNGETLNPTCYTASYLNVDRPGVATLVIRGKSELGYYGTKTIDFTISGRPFSKKTITVENIENKKYNGKAQIQDKIRVIYTDGDGYGELKYGQDYYLTYKNNVNKGNATVTVMPVAESGYSGKLALKFKIESADISDGKTVEMEGSLKNVEVPFNKSGAKINSFIKLYLTETKQANVKYLTEGKDYTVTYLNNTILSGGSLKPTAVISGKGNYSGKIYVDDWKIVKKSVSTNDITSGEISVSNKPVMFNENKADDYAYIPQLIIKHGNAVLKQGVDYNLTYYKNTEAELKAYYAGGKTNDRPYVQITNVDGSGYDFNGLSFSLPVYRKKLTATNVDIVVANAEYSNDSKSLLAYPEVKVSLGGKQLEELKDYTVSYAAVKSAGAKKGTVQITFFGPEYGGVVKAKYDIKKRVIK